MLGLSLGDPTHSIQTSWGLVLTDTTGIHVPMKGTGCGVFDNLMVIPAEINRPLSRRPAKSGSNRIQPTEVAWTDNTLLLQECTSPTFPQHGQDPYCGQESEYAGVMHLCSFRHDCFSPGARKSSGADRTSSSNDRSTEVAISCSGSKAETVKCL